MDTALRAVFVWGSLPNPIRIYECEHLVLPGMVGNEVSRPPGPLVVTGAEPAGGALAGHEHLSAFGPLALDQGGHLAAAPLMEPFSDLFLAALLHVDGEVLLEVHAVGIRLLPAGAPGGGARPPRVGVGVPGLQVPRGEREVTVDESEVIGQVGGAGALAAARGARPPFRQRQDRIDLKEAAAADSFVRKQLPPGPGIERGVRDAALARQDGKALPPRRGVDFRQLVSCRAHRNP